MSRVSKSNSETYSLLRKMTTFARIVFFILAVAVVVSRPSYGVTLYSGGSLGSTGTIYGWGVTDATYGGYTHTAYATATLRSPKGRTATYGRSAYNTVRADVSLGWDETDLGTYSTTTTHRAYCNYMGWFINGTVTSAYFKIGVQQIQFYWDTFQDPPYGCYYAQNCQPAPAGSYCGPSFFSTSHNKLNPPYCYIYDSRRYIFFKSGSSLVCWKLPFSDDNYYSDSYWAYPCDAAIP